MFDFVNIIYILTILLIVQKTYKIKNLYFIILVCHLFSIFLFNGFFFESNYMPDQFKYLELAKDIRGFNIEDLSQHSKNTIFYSGLVFGLFPIPFIDSLYSIGMINFLLYLAIFIFI